ncbi:MAG: serpin family protein [Anaerolineaceae bacterium]|nr:serpin family protein [Anaerolineaceae bacterium]
MKTLLKSVLLLFVISLILSACNPVEPVEAIQSDLSRDTQPIIGEGDIASVAKGNNAFGWDLFQQLQSESGNLFYSPYSISSALAMTWAGARGDTETQMAQVLHFNLDQVALHPAFNGLMLALDSRAEAEGIEPDQAFKLNIANALWGQQGFAFLSEFLDTLALNYGAGLYLVDFQNDPEGARKDVNDWVARETEEKIKDIVPPGAIDAMTRLVLANAIYFKADWASEFSKDETSDQDFHLVDGSTVSTPTMYQSGSFRYAQGDGVQALELPYAGDQLSMVILLPDDGQLDAFQSGLGATTLDELFGKLEYQQVDIHLPKFKYEYSLSLAKALINMGMTDAFDMGAADFSGMDGERDLYIGDVLHKAFVAVDEAGTEAAAATVVIMKLTAMLPGDAIEFRVDRPFLFVIRDIPSGAILFVGRVMNP